MARARTAGAVRELCARAMQVAAWLAGAVCALAAVPGALLGAWREWQRARCLSARFPCRPPWPLVGHLLDCGLFASVPDLMDYLTSECNRLRTGRAEIGPFRHIFIADPRDIQVFVSNSKNQSKTFLYKFTGETIGEGLVSVSGVKWRRHHKVIAPAFYASALDSFVSVFNRQSDDLVQLLRQHAHGRAFDVAPTIERTAFAIICETAMGIRVNLENQNDKEYYRALEVVTSELVQRIQRPWLYPEFLYRLTPGGRRAAEAHNILRNAQSKAMGEHRKDVDSCQARATGDQSGPKQRLSFIDVLIAQKKNGALISDEEIAEEVDTLMFTGFDTVKLLVGFTLLALSNNSDIQKRILEELESIFHSTDPVDVTPDTLRQMTYLEKVVKETLRMYPPVWFFARKAGVDVPLVSCDMIIPSGSDVIIPIKAVHMDPKLYPDPEVFDPERFSSENTAQRHSYGFIPFGSGQRICIGRRYAMMEAKTILAKLLWHYKVQPDTSYEPIYTWGITSPTTNGLWIKLQERSR